MTLESPQNMRPAQRGRAWEWTQRTKGPEIQERGDEERAVWDISRDANLRTIKMHRENNQKWYIYQK